MNILRTKFQQLLRAHFSIGVVQPVVFMHIYNNNLTCLEEERTGRDLAVTTPCTSLEKNHLKSQDSSDK